ncbi:MAG: NAD(P)H-dependent flavin oxidoreductase, partial [Erysipelotrichaceae bacterium]
MKGVQLGHHFLEVPIIQGGMGIGVSLSNLAGAVAANGGMGVISAAQPGYEKAEFKKNPLHENIVALQEEVQKARTIAKGKGMLAINVMAAGNHYAEIVRGCVQTGVDAIISGAGLPLDLPGMVADSDVLIAPIVSSGKALELLCKAWSKRYNRMPDFVVIEGPLAGGHLGFRLESLVDGTATKLEDILQEVLCVLQGWKTNIPVFVA